MGNLWKVVAVLSPVALLVTACGQGGAGQTPSSTAITVAESPATTGTIKSILSYSASVSPKWTVNIIPQASGPVQEVKVKQGQAVNKGDVIAVIDHRSLDDQVAQAQANLSSAQAKLNSMKAGGRPEDVAAANANVEAARQKLAEAQAGGRSESVQQAQAKLDADQASLNKLLAGPSPQDVTNAQLAVEAAKDNLFAQQTAYDRQVAQGIVSPQQRQAALDVAQTQIDQANTQLAKLTAPPRPEDVAAAKAAVQADQQALSVAKQPNRPEDIEQLKQALIAQQAQAAKAAAPYTGDDIAQAQAAVQVAQAALQSAQTAQSNATVVSPAAGIISDLPIAAGSAVGPTSPVATLISSDLEVDSSVEESQVGLFKEGQPAQIVVGSGSPLDGQVAFVAPSADPKTRKFAVKVVPAAEAPALRAGMSATVKIQTGEQSDAVLIPKDAVLQRNGQQVVFIDSSGRARLTPVKTGISDDQTIQVLSGVTPGALVILPGSLNLADGDAVTRAPSQPGPAPIGTPAGSPAPSSSASSAG